MKEVQYTGLRPMGTLKPRRMWMPGEVLMIEDDALAEELVSNPGFKLVEKTKARKKEKA